MKFTYEAKLKKTIELTPESFPDFQGSEAEFPAYVVSYYEDNTDDIVEALLVWLQENELDEEDYEVKRTS